MRTIISLLLLANIALANQQDYVENRGIDDPELYEGDMKLTMDQRMEVESRGERAAINVQLWPNGEIIYDLDPTFSSEPRAMARLNEAIAEYRQKTCIRFKKRTTEKAYILVITRSGCWSYIGRIGKAQKLSLGKNCWYKGTVIHEFAHALGFIHEQSRPDRDDYVEIKYENILLGQEGNFKKHASANSQGTPYDYYSVMHYSAKLFSKNGQPTLVPKKPGVSLNYRNGLSPIDVQEINMLYKCKTVTPVSPTVPPTHAPQTPAPPTRPPITQAPQTQVPPGTTSFKCNFDQDICGFTQKSNDKFDWLRRSGRTPSSQTGPATDHTTGHGSYMYIETSAPRRPNDNAVIDRQVTLTGNSCLMFYYHMYGLDVNALNVYLGGSKIFTMQGNQGNAWKIAEVRLSGTGRPQTLSFEGVRGASYRGDIAVDDIMVQECQGVNVPTTQAPTPLPTQPPTKPPTRPPTQQSSFKCTFEQTCGFSQRKDDKFDWTRRRGTTPSSQTGPDGDHTTKNGYYMYIEASYPRRKGDSAVMERSVSVSSNTCLTFYYNMYGFHIGTLNVRLGNQVVFTKSGPQGKQWVKAEVPLKTVGTQKLSFEGIRGAEYSGDIAIDDITVDTCGGGPTPPTQPPTPAPPSGSCGIRPHTRIVGGTAAKHGDWPWQVQLRTTSGFPYCGGSLIHPQYILTATHCVRGKQPGSIVIRLGAHRRVKTVGTEQDIKVVKVITHQSYHKPTTYAHDIALLKLEKPAMLNKHVSLVCLPENVPAPSDGSHCWVTGWGRLSSGGATPDYLQQVSVPIAGRARCDKAYPNKIHDSMICAGLDQGGKDSCQGDSGGPMVCETGGRFYIHGATSWGYGCASPGKFGVYAKVTYLLQWIKDEMKKN